MSPNDNWYGSVFRKLHLDYHQPPWMPGVAAQVTPELARQQAGMFRESGVEAVEFFAHDHHGYCFFPADPPGRPHPGLGSDYVGNMTAALKAEGLRTIAYLNVYTNVWLKDEHPDWVLRTPDGARIGGGWLQFEGSFMCPSSPYLREYFLPLLGQLVRRYDLDVIWLDAGIWLADTLCHCDYCRAAYRTDTGRELPQGWPSPATRPSDVKKWAQHSPPQAQRWTLSDVDGEDENWLAWTTWRLGQVPPYLKAIRETLDNVRPGILFTDNSSGRFTLPQPLVEDGRLARWLRPAELGIDFASSDPVPWGGNHEIILSREGRYHATSGLAFDFMNERFHKWGEWQLRATTDFELEFATILAVGGRCFFADQPYPDGTLEPAIYAELRRAYDFVAQREPFVRDAEMVPDVALLASAPSQLFGPLGSGRNPGRVDYGLVGGDHAARRTDRIDGAHLALTELGIQTLLYDEPTLRERLADQTAVIVAEQPLLEEATLDALARYVEDGGSLLVTGRSGWWDEAGRARTDARLYDLLGLRVRDVYPAPVHYVRTRAAFRGDAALPDIPLQCWGTAVAVEPVEAAVLADLLGPLPAVWRDGVQDEAHWQHYTTMGACPPDKEVLGPAVTVRRYGKGFAFFSAVDPFAAYRHEGHHLARLFITRLMALVAPVERRRLSAEKPLNVELSLQRQGERLIVHLLNYTGQKRAGNLAHVEELIPVRDILLRVQTGDCPKQVILQPGDTPLPYDFAAGVTTVVVPELHIHAMVVIE